MKSTSYKRPLGLQISWFAAGVLFALPFKSQAAEQVAGLVKVVGSAYNARVVLVAETGEAKHQLCKDDVAKKVGRLTGMVVAATGNWDAHDPKDRCFATETFEIEKASSGRKPLVGTLNKKGEVFNIETGDGKQHTLDKVAGSLVTMIGKKVIVDVKPLKTATGAETWKVVTYSEYP
jgi:hypothetical protein